MPKQLQKDIERSFPYVAKGMNKSYEFAHEYNPELAELLRQIFAILMRPLVALKAKLYRTFLRPFKKLEQKNIPVFRLAMVFLAFSIIYTKDFSFSFSVGNPLALASKIGQNGDNGSAMPVNEYAPVDASNLKEESTEAYIKKYKDLAITEMIQFGVPASITLGQAIIESRAGNSRLARENNNHFGVKCFSKKCKKGHCTNHKDDHHKDFFRKYESVWESYRNHSQFLQKDRYKNLKNYGKDYKKWAKGLRKAGYATDKKYDKKLISVIERYKLYQYDK